MSRIKYIFTWVQIFDFYKFIEVIVNIYRKLYAF